ncbi:lymphotactin [Dasypus novemcinctus]|uniref:lymphotactin n=1 Tax=Dasypus novemcinctus TaxID=9361 RepID=UPI00266027CB|nr:lymphotactin [Dasypus novemcinctus]
MRLLILAFLGICCLTAYNVEGVGTEVSQKTTCLSLTMRPLPVHKIKRYTIKEGTMRAVIFVTRHGLRICADPEANWVKAAVKSVDSKSLLRRNTIKIKPTGAQQSTSTAVSLTG